MDKFLEAYRISMGFEGAYGFDPQDPGGETYKGISRIAHPEWVGWRIIDNAKKNDPDFPASLKYNSYLETDVRNFYKEHYWDVYRGDDLPDELADEMFDIAINMGIGIAISFLQQALNVLNRNGQMYNDLIEDKVFGDKTFNAIKILLQHDPVSLLVNVMNILQGAHYIDIMQRDHAMERYARGWLKRVRVSINR